MMASPFYIEEVLNAYKNTQLVSIYEQNVPLKSCSVSMSYCQLCGQGYDDTHIMYNESQSYSCINLHISK